MINKKIIIPLLAIFGLYTFSGRDKKIVTISNGYLPTFGSNGGINESYLNIKPEPNNRGIRNNNPTNIIYNSNNNWQGKIPYSQNSDTNISTGNISKKFEQFYTYPEGVRAAIILLKTARIANGDDTLKKIIQVWAVPYNPNYTAYLSQFTGLGENQTIIPTYDNLKKIIQGVARFENGRTAPIYPEVVTDEQFNTAYSIL